MARRRRGSVNGAIIEYLQTRSEGASVAEIQAAVEAALGGEVARSSVRGWLNKNEGKIVTRIALGRYRLR